MNAPNFNFDAESGSTHLPAPATQGSQSITHATRDVTANFAAAEEQASGDFRKLFFICLALALKYRWLILAICAVALVIGFIQTFTTTPIYQATVTIQIDRQAAKVVKLDAPQDNVIDGGDR